MMNRNELAGFLTVKEIFDQHLDGDFSSARAIAKRLQQAINACIYRIDQDRGSLIDISFTETLNSIGITHTATQADPFVLCTADQKSNRNEVVRLSDWSGADLQPLTNKKGVIVADCDVDLLKEIQKTLSKETIIVNTSNLTSKNKTKIFPHMHLVPYLGKVTQHHMKENPANIAVAAAKIHLMNQLRLRRAFVSSLNVADFKNVCDVFSRLTQPANENVSALKNKSGGSIKSLENFGKNHYDNNCKRNKHRFSNDVDADISAQAM